MSVSKGVLVTERDRRKQSTDRSRVAGEVVHRRDHKGDKGDFEGFATDPKEVLKKKPDQKLKWVTKAFHLVAKGTIEVTVLYDILAHPKFASALSKGIGRQARSIIDANIHVFSAKQQKFLQSDTCKWSSFELGGSAPEVEEPVHEEEVEVEEENSEAIAARIAKYMEEAPKEIPNTNWVQKSTSETALEKAYTESAIAGSGVGTSIKLTPWQKKKNEEGVKFNAFESAALVPGKKIAKKIGNVFEETANDAAAAGAEAVPAKALWLPANAAAAKAKDTAKVAQQSQQVVISSVATRSDDSAKPGSEAQLSSEAKTSEVADSQNLPNGTTDPVDSALAPGGSADKDSKDKEESQKSSKDKDKDEVEKPVKEKKEKDDSSKSKRERSESGNKKNKSESKSKKERKDDSDSKKAKKSSDVGKDRKDARDGSKERKDANDKEKKEKKESAKEAKEKKEKRESSKDRKDADDKERKEESEKDRKDSGDSGKSRKESKDSSKHKKDSGESAKDRKDSGDAKDRKDSAETGKERKDTKESGKDKKDTGESGKDKKESKDKSGKNKDKHRSKSKSRDRSRSRNEQKTSDRRKRDRSRSHRSRSYRSRSQRRRKSRSRSKKDRDKSKSRDRDRRSKAKEAKEAKDFINQRVEKMVSR